MVYKNTYHGYSDTEYGYHGEQGHGTEHVYGYQGGHGPHHAQADGGHHAHQEEYGAGSQQVVIGVPGLHFQQTTQVQTSWGVNASYNASTYRVQNPSTPPDGSQQNLLKLEADVERWPGESDFLASTWAFTLSLHSLWSLPIVIIQHGGLVFLLIYMLLLAILGAPLLLLEMFLGQYSGLAPIRVFRHLSPVLTGLGLAMCIQAAIRAVLELGVLMWMGQGMFRLFYHQKISEGLFSQDILNREDASLEALGTVSTQLLLVLGIATLTVFVLVVAGTRSVGKVCMVTVPACFMIIVTLVIRACLATGGPQGVLTFLHPDWSLLKEPTIWLEAASQVVFSLQLGLGAITAYSRYSKFRHNIVRDCTIVIVSHLVWVLLAVLLTFSLLGVALSAETISLTGVSAVPALVSVTGHGVWLAAITLIETSLATISYGWLWAGLFFILLVLVSITSLFGYLEVITSSLLSQRPSILPFKPALTFTVLALIFLMDLVLATQGGIHVYHLLLTYISNWPTLLFSLLTVLATVLCHSTDHLMKDLSSMSKISLPYWVTSHLSVLYFSVLPTFLTISLVQSLYTLSIHHLAEPLSTFGLSLPHWGMPMGWSLAFLPISPIVFGAVVHCVWGARGVPRLLHLMNSVKSTERWSRNERLELEETSGDIGQRNENVSTA
eukprot:GFUD01035905.1.p1 GENE.GFUD01035905.1~~GFUD01035905.1.p1  ORF type:complete len:666 (-),score=128.90 GFUD01035905.1:19-2016(-)